MDRHPYMAPYSFHITPTLRGKWWIPTCNVTPTPYSTPSLTSVQSPRLAEGTGILLLPCLFNQSGKYDGCKRTLFCKPSIIFLNNSYASHVLRLVQLCDKRSRLHAECLLTPLSSKDVIKHDCVCQYRSQSHQRTGYLYRK